MENWIKTLKQKTINNGNIKESEIISIIPFEMIEKWDNFMRGKTCPLLDDGDHGVYTWDLNQFLNSF